MQWNGNNYSNAFGNSSIGSGYMFITTQDTNQKIDATNDECLPFITVTPSSEWTLIGNPWLQTIQWSKIESVNGFTGGGFLVFNGGWTLQGSLSQLRGAFINSGDIASVNFFIDNPKLNSFEEEFHGKGYNDLDDGEWLLDLELKGGKVHHKISQIGQRVDALNLKDKYDLSMPPSLGKPFDIKFDLNTVRDIKSLQDHNIGWDFTVENDYSLKTTIFWSLQSSHNSNLYLLDNNSGDLVNMSKESSYSFTGKSSRSFKIIKGELAFISEQTGRSVGGFRLYPNPTSKYLYVESYAKISTDQIKVYTVDGKEVIPSSKDIIREDDLSQIIRLGVENISKGTYVILTKGNSKVFVKE